VATAKYDREADALYVRLADGPIARTVEVDDYRVVDLGSNDSPVGFEVLYPSANLQISKIAIDFGFSERLAEIDDAVSEALGAQPAQIVPVSITYVLAEKATTSVWVAAPKPSRDSTAHPPLVLS
jgi:uncharacterized protein YuzE